MGKSNSHSRTRFELGPPGPQKLFHYVTVFFISEKEKADFREVGIDFKRVTKGPRGEAAAFEIGEEDARWVGVAALLASLESNHQASKKRRVQDVLMTKPTFEESLQMAVTSIKEQLIAGTSWLNGYEGRTVEELISLEGKYRIDSLVSAFEEAIGQKLQRDGSTALNDEEQTVMAVEALEREVNNGGYNQFFTNSSNGFAAIIVDSLRRIGCKKTARLTQRAIDALEISDLTVEAIDTEMAIDNKQRTKKLNACDETYYRAAEPIAERLFAFIKLNRQNIRVR
jgi:hypothetical protein